MSKNIIKVGLLFVFLSPLAIAQNFVPGQVLTASQLNSALGTKAGISDLAGTSSDKGAAMVGFSHTTTYTDGTLGARLRNVVFVTDPPYLAKCDGVTNDSVAITSAIGAIGGGTVAIPDGRICAIGSTLTLSATGASIVSKGGTLKKLAAVDAIVLTGVNNKVIGVRINGNDLAGSGIGIKGRQGTVSRVISYNHGSHGIYADGQSTNCWQNDISNNEVYGNGEVGIAQNKCVENRIIGNNAHDNNFEGITVDNQANKGIVANNIVINNNLTGGVGGIGIDYSSYVTITGNVIERSQSSKPGIKTQNNLGSTSYLTITGNSFNANTGGGVWFYSNGAAYTTNSIISSNVFDGVGTNAIQIDAGSNDNAVVGNDLSGGEFVNNASGTMQLVRLNTGKTNIRGDFLGLGAAPSPSNVVTVAGTAPQSSASGRSYGNSLTLPSNITSWYVGYHSEVTTAATPFTLTELSHFKVQPPVFGNGSVVTNQFGFYAASLTGASNNFGFYSATAEGSNRWNFYASGSANNAYAGKSRFGDTTVPMATIDVNGNIAATTSILSTGATAGIGYATGAGGAVIQVTSKTTGVTLNKVTGKVTLSNSALAAAATTCFTLTNSAIAATDVVNAVIASGATSGAYTLQVEAVAAGSCRMCLNNRSAGSLSEAVVINYTVLKGSEN